MPDTPRTIAQMLAALADNTTGLITPQVMRDLVVTMKPSHGCIYTLGTPLVTPIAAQNAWTPLTGDTALRDELSTDDISNGGGIVTYNGPTPRVFKITATVEANSASNNQQIAFTFAKNGVPDETYMSHFFYTSGNRPLTVPLHGLMRMVQGDDLSVVVRNETSNADITVLSLNITILGFTE